MRLYPSYKDYESTFKERLLQVAHSVDARKLCENYMVASLATSIQAVWRHISL